MKRIIKFRAKDKKTGKWAYGDLTHSKGINAEVEKLIYDRVMVANYEVDEDTVGQFTGLKDKNGKEIYMGDIISINDRPFGYIKWNPNGYFYIHTSTICEYQDCIVVGKMIKNYPSEVVGNIHDNPELIKDK